MSSLKTASNNEPFALIAYRADAYSFAESIDFWRDLRIEIRPFELLGHMDDAPSHLENGSIDFLLRIPGAILSVSITRLQDQVIERYEIEYLDADAYADARDLLELKLMEGADFGLAGGLVAEPGAASEDPQFQVYSQVYSQPVAGTLHGNANYRRQRLGLRHLADALLGSLPSLHAAFTTRQPVGAVA